ncbi:MAG: hypothetical protein HZC03_01150 [Candidatus Lloydbacteria bacterium]|nr:hypothetical protein [Candidatus Lloydbacteria bacterium]
MLKYPWTALSLIIIWVTTTYIIILNQSNLDVNRILFMALIGTVIISTFGFRPPRIER